MTPFSPVHEVTRVGLDDQPHFPARGESQRIASGQGEVHFHLHATLHSRRNNHIASFKAGDASRDHVAGT